MMLSNYQNEKVIWLKYIVTLVMIIKENFQGVFIRSENFKFPRSTELIRS